MADIRLCSLAEFARMKLDLPEINLRGAEPDYDVVPHRVMQGEPLFLVVDACRWYRGDDVAAGIWASIDTLAWRGIDDSPTDWVCRPTGILFRSFLVDDEYAQNPYRTETTDKIRRVILDCRVIVARVGRRIVGSRGR